MLFIYCHNATFPCSDAIDECPRWRGRGSLLEDKFVVERFPTLGQDAGFLLLPKSGDATVAA